MGALIKQSLTVITIICAACSTARPLARPNSVAPAADGSVYILDFGNYQISHFAADTQPLLSFGSLGNAPDQIFYGFDLTRDSNGNLYFSNQVGDNANSTHEGIKVFSPDGQFLREIGGVDYTLDSERVYSTYGLDIDSADRLYTADYGTNTVRVFDADGQLLTELFGNGQLSGLSDVAVDDTRGLLYVSETLNSQIQQFAFTAGPPLVLAAPTQTFGAYGRAPGQFAYPQSLAVDEATGRLYVGDVANRRVQIFESSGAYVTQILTPNGVADWQVQGLSVGADGALYVADALNNAVWVFEADGTLRTKIGGG